MSSGATATNLCPGCNQFFQDELTKHDTFYHESPADWSAHGAALYDDFAVADLPNLISKDCPLCLLIFHGLELDQPQFHGLSGTVTLQTNPGGRSPSVQGQICHLIATFRDAACSKGQSEPQVMRMVEIMLEPLAEATIPIELSGLFESRAKDGDHSTDSKFCFELAKWWIKTCQDSHSACSRDVGNLPYRVIDIGEVDGPQKLRLVESLAEKEPYIALSYCWGDSVPLTTTFQNLNERKREILFQEMPKTFRDAVTITRGLGIRYLWIDALCIVQDRFEDWETHSTQMSVIYANAAVTIAAAHASNTLQGCFSPRNGMRSHRYQLDRSDAGGKVSSWIASILQSSENSSSAEDSPLFGRAWVRLRAM